MAQTIRKRFRLESDASISNAATNAKVGLNLLRNILSAALVGSTTEKRVVNSYIQPDGNSKHTRKKQKEQE